MFARADMPIRPYTMVFVDRRRWTTGNGPICNLQSTICNCISRAEGDPMTIARDDSPISYVHPPPSEAEVFGALRQCFDPCCREKGISVVDMGLIEAVAVSGRDVRIDMVLTSGWCPFAMHLLTDMEQQVAALEGVANVAVNIV